MCKKEINWSAESLGEDVDTHSGNFHLLTRTENIRREYFILHPPLSKTLLISTKHALFITDTFTQSTHFVSM